MKKNIILILAILLFIPRNVLANDNVNIYLFYSETCHFCHDADDAIKSLVNENDKLKYYKYETSKDQNIYNRIMLNKVQEHFHINETAYPLVIIGNRYIIGYDDSIKDEYINIINNALNITYTDDTGVILSLVDNNNNNLKKEYKIKTILGTINLKNKQLFLTSIILGINDSINTNHLWVIFLVTSIIILIIDRKKQIKASITYFITSALISLIYIMSWSTINNYQKIIEILLGITIFSLGFISLYQYKQKNKELLFKDKNWIMILCMIIVSVLISIVENNLIWAPPLMWSELVSISNLNEASYVIYLLIYTSFYLLDKIILISILTYILSKQKIIKTSIISLVLLIIIGICLIINAKWLIFNF